MLQRIPTPLEAEAVNRAGRRAVRGFAKSSNRSSNRAWRFEPARWRIASGAAAFCLGLVAPPSAAELPDAREIAHSLGHSDEDIQRALDGEIVHGTTEPSNERELTSTMMFLIRGRSPTELIEVGLKGQLERVDENTLAWSPVDPPATPAKMDGLKLDPDGPERAKAFATASPGGDLNLSTAEMARFNALGSDASTATVEKTLREVLAARLEAYRTKGLDGIAPYAREGGVERSVASDLRTAADTLDRLQKWVPHAYASLVDYPKSRIEGTREQLRWTHFEGAGVPTVALEHIAFVPEGDAWLLFQRHYFVSTGYNCLQTVVALIPVKRGTAVFYVNRTSTDQVMGFGGGAKRSIGSRIMSRDLVKLYGRFRDSQEAH